MRRQKSQAAAAAATKKQPLNAKSTNVVVTSGGGDKANASRDPAQLPAQFAPPLSSTPAAALIGRAAVRNRPATAAAAAVPSPVARRVEASATPASSGARQSYRRSAAPAVVRPRVSASPEPPAAVAGENDVDSDDSLSAAAPADNAENEPARAARRPSHPPASASHSKKSTTAAAPSGSKSQQLARKPQQQHRRKRQHVERQIRYFQSSTDLLIRKLPFMRLVKEITAYLKHNGQLVVSPGVGDTWQALAICCLQTAAEAYVVQVLSDAYRLCQHRSRITLSREDLLLVCQLCNHGI
ncbi:hypothetical protein BOX15_Mlig000639g2 [Macrostomum lignano]|uniref:Core Histone H2A/H2B/H3 domain-containing protein n=1 Tax=Macrostomum lignano TaxID=282301 RepID=A0A267FXC3_9PLAT|nr:hypothetical protein BOX15_Mlig000639g2 [Macrostomum lignano]